jgi:putative transposase
MRTRYSTLIPERHQFDSLFEAQVLTEAWRIDYNNHQPHSAHGWLTPVKFVERWVHGQQLQLA